ncbi:MAG: DUF2892 domain-containing protein [Gammaproteobacteria bacterium]|nr:MAG: DUF2892 domain-containing protein [Gammaproteobacteria bacterium]
MTVNSAVNAMAGAFVLIGLGLAHFSNTIDITQPSWLWLVAFVGANLFQSSFTGFCPAKSVFRALGLKDADAGNSCCS